MLRFLFVGTSLCLMSVMCLGQSKGGMRIYTGISATYNQDENINPDGTGHFGYTIGFDGRVNSGDLHFLIGGRYTSTSLLAESSKSFFKNDEDYKLATGSFGLGFTMVNFSYKSRLRGKMLVFATTSINNPKNKLDIPGYEIVNDSWGGIRTGVGIDYGFLTFDMEYHKGLVNTYRNQDESKANTIIIAIGFFF